MTRGHHCTEPDLHVGMLGPGDRLRAASERSCGHADQLVQKLSTLLSSLGLFNARNVARGGTSCKIGVLAVSALLPSMMLNPPDLIVLDYGVSDFRTRTAEIGGIVEAIMIIVEELAPNAPS